ncbi:hypothetical protein GM921_04580 [Pedobacter sp. LMG 31464]|uniref:MG2 domain-containing protein n=1 Tax=Pedobacter planticolens TaxID=2679964 RepID=A0A923DX94_9SPHI|nr:hypothetical protein [Pedobacter planticolens]MBB2144746.1 hypothetical protein [Pedobacter planticolens]
MYKIYVKSLLIFLVLACSTRLNAQVLPKVQQAFTTYNEDRFKEKIFVHTDKDSYLAGELIWFKAYSLNASNNQTVAFSNVLYVDVLDQANNFILQAKIELNNGSGNGSFYIPKTVISGAYKLRAYTNWLKNFGTESFFEKQLNFVNLTEKYENVKNKPVAYDIQFFPEGGDLVEGLTSRVAFKVTGKDGKGTNLNGVIVNEKNDTVARFSTLKFGMGSFTFKPIINHNYKVVATSIEKEILIKELPRAKKKGYSMNVSVADDDISVKVTTNLAVNDAYLFIHNNKQVTLAEKMVIGNGKAEFKLKKNSLKDGVSSFTIFDGNGLPICERLFFKKPTQKLLIEAVTDQKSYTSRKNVKVNLLTKNEKGQLERGDFSVSVYKLDSLNKTPKADIVNYVWLESELKGDIESPDYYFSTDNEGANEALDNLMLTQGWRHFKWDEVLTQQKPSFKFLPELNGHLINGTTTLNGNLVSQKVIYMGIPGKNYQFYATKSDSTGNFLVNTKKLFGANELVLQNGNELDSNVQIKILSPFLEQFSKKKYSTDEINSSMIRALQENSLTVEVQNTFISSKLKQYFSPNVDSALFYGSAYKTYKLDDYTRFPTMDEVLREYVAEVGVLKRQKRSHIKMISEYDFLNEDPLVLLDGVPYVNMDLVMAFDPLKIEKLEVVRNRYFLGGIPFEGILNFTTAKGDLGGQRLDPHSIVLDYEGMELQREFYQPVYDTKLQMESRIPDFRSVLYWSPEIKFDEKSKAQLNFYTSDQLGSYIGIIQGISKNGVPGSRYFTFEVTK